MKSIPDITTKILLILSFFASIFFLAPQTADAACTVERNSTTRFRTAYTTGGGVQPLSFFNDEDNPPFVYLDINTDGCDNNETISIRLFGLSSATSIHTKGDLVSLLSSPIDVQTGTANVDSEGRFTVTTRAGTKTCSAFNDDRDCLIIAMIQNGNTGEILAMLGDALGNLSPQDVNVFRQYFASSIPVTPSSATGATCTGFGTDVGYYFQQAVPCASFLSTVPGFTAIGSLLGLDPSFNGYGNSLDSLLLEYYNNYPNITWPNADGVSFPYSFGETGVLDTEYRIALPGLSFDCPDATTCDSSIPWQIMPNGSLPYGTTHSSDQGIVAVQPLSDYQEFYVPLAPLPFEGLNGGETPSLGSYLAGLFRAGVIIVVILAVIMIVFNSIRYITTSAIGKKTEIKDVLYNAVMGLLIALGSWLLLNTISPNLASDLSISIPEVELTIDQQAYSDYEQQVPESGSAFVLSGTFENPATSPGLSSFLETINDENPITNIVVNTSGLTMTINSSANYSVTIPVTGLGANGVSEIGQGVSGDRKTPKGNWQTTNRTRVAQNMNDAQVSQGGFSMGPAFIGTNISTPNGEVRGIWIHGNRNNNSGPTMGCVRLKNDDVLALARKIEPGVPLVIQ